MPMARGSEISAAGVYLLDAGVELTLWVGYHASPAFLHDVFGTATPKDAMPLQPPSASEAATKLHALLEAARAGRPVRPPLRVVVQGSPQQPCFFGHLVAEGYEPFVINLHAARVRPSL